MGPLAAVAIVIGVLVGGRASAEDGRTAAAAAAARGNPARAVSLYEEVAGRSGFLMLLDPGASASADFDAQVARIAWARNLAATGDIDVAVAVLAKVQASSLLAQATQASAQILVDAAASAVAAGHAELALQRLNQAMEGSPPAALKATIAAMRGTAEVGAAAELVAAGRGPDALALLADASQNGAAPAAAAEYPAALLAAAQVEIGVLDYKEAEATLQMLVDKYGASAQATAADHLLHAPQTVSGTLVDDLGHGTLGRVRLATHFTQLSGGYITSGPFYYGVTNATGDFSIPAVPFGGPYVLEYSRSGGWMTLVDPRNDTPANLVTVGSLQTEDLNFIVVPH